MTREELIETSESLTRQKYVSSISLKGRPPNEVTYGETYVVANHRAKGSDYNHHPEMKVALGGKEASGE